MGITYREIYITDMIKKFYKSLDSDFNPYSSILSIIVTYDKIVLLYSFITEYKML